MEPEKGMSLHHNKGYPYDTEKEELYTRHRNTVKPTMVKKDMKATLLAPHTDAVNKAVKGHERNVVQSRGERPRLK